MFFFSLSGSVLDLQPVQSVPSLSHSDYWAPVNMATTQTQQTNKPEYYHESMKLLWFLKVNPKCEKRNSRELNMSLCGIPPLSGP